MSSMSFMRKVRHSPKHNEVVYNELVYIVSKNVTSRVLCKSVFRDHSRDHLNNVAFSAQRDIPRDMHVMSDRIYY